MSAERRAAYLRECALTGMLIGLSAEEVAQVDDDVWRECALKAPAIVEWMRSEALRRVGLPQAEGSTT